MAGPDRYLRYFLSALLTRYLRRRLQDRVINVNNGLFSRNYEARVLVEVVVRFGVCVCGPTILIESSFVAEP